MSPGSVERGAGGYEYVDGPFICSCVCGFIR